MSVFELSYRSDGRNYAYNCAGGTSFDHLSELTLRSLLDVAHVALHVFTFEDSCPQVALESSNFNPIQWGVLAVHLRVLDLG